MFLNVEIPEWKPVERIISHWEKPEFLEGKFVTIPLRLVRTRYISENTGETIYLYKIESPKNPIPIIDHEFRSEFNLLRKFLNKEGFTLNKEKGTEIVHFIYIKE